MLVTPNASIGKANLLGKPNEIHLTYHEDILVHVHHLSKERSSEHRELSHAGHCHHIIAGKITCPLPGHGPSHIIPEHKDPKTDIEGAIPITKNIGNALGIETV